jgi:hypothetical protein
MSNPNPNCERECRFSHGPTMTTAMYYKPVYDKHGNNLNPDGNISSFRVSCSVCGKHWMGSCQLGNYQFEELDIEKV